MILWGNIPVLRKYMLIIKGEILGVSCHRMSATYFQRFSKESKVCGVCYRERQ